MSTGTFLAWFKNSKLRRKTHFPGKAGFPGYSVYINYIEQIHDLFYKNVQIIFILYFIILYNSKPYFGEGSAIWKVIMI